MYISIIFFGLFFLLTLSSILYFYILEYKNRRLRNEVRKILISFNEDCVALIKSNFGNQLSSRVKGYKSGGKYYFSYLFSDGSVYKFKYYNYEILLTFKERNYKITNQDIINDIISSSNLLIDYFDKIRKDSIETRINKYNQDIKNAKHPKWEIYQSLLNNIKFRKEQLKKLSHKDDSRISLENELKSVENKINLLKNKYGFE